MASNTIKTRVQLKCDTEANWDRAVNFRPLKGEVIIYSTDDTHPFSRFKVGDGSTLVSDLPFIDAATLNGLKVEIGTTVEWQTRSNYTPNKGDILIYTDKETLNDNTTVPGIKIGDGLAYGIDLPFIGDDIAENLLNHISDSVKHITAAERTKWNNKITCEDTVSNETLILTRN